MNSKPESKHGYSSSLRLNTTVDLGTNHKLATIAPAIPDEWSGGAGEVELCEEAMVLLREVNSGMDHREGGEKVLVSDITAICEIFNSTAVYPHDCAGRLIRRIEK